ncbi:phage tail protein [Nocardioides guangzhouensis]|uniref:Phage tail protein n=1 Tax=Nocardioides guangzhouensis TaxID=2497878 RepID=A0A4Q4ZL37_9ACTN|nr:phage tail protein [Nocardioides guangzhouensis]RYP88236.1 phage tail protein [Nocardioides guangzhouensis]
MEREPLAASSFEVEAGEDRIGCSEVLGLALEPGAEPAATVTLRRAAGVDDALVAWARRPEPRRVVVTVLDARHEPACRYVLDEARPVRWTGPALDALSATVAVEELLLEAADLRQE